MRSRLVCALGLAVSLLLSAAAPSYAAVADIAVEKEYAAIWLETTVSQGSDEPLRVKVFAPAEDGRRTLWQVCSFPSADGGPYRCGLDREAVERESGRWVVRALLDGEVIGRREFWIR